MKRGAQFVALYSKKCRQKTSGGVDLGKLVASAEVPSIIKNAFFCRRHKTSAFLESKCRQKTRRFSNQNVAKKHGVFRIDGLPPAEGPSLERKTGVGLHREDEKGQVRHHARFPADS